MHEDVKTDTRQKLGLHYGRAVFLIAADCGEFPRRSVSKQLTNNVGMIFVNLVFGLVVLDDFLKVFQ